MTDLIHPVEKVPGLVGELYALVAQLEALFPGRRFTPDGHLVGSIGEELQRIATASTCYLTQHRGMMLARRRACW